LRDLRRDLRLDFIRGLAIYMILLDHVTGDPLGKLTYHAIGFSDSAELFVFVSGLACGIAYSRKLAREGYQGLWIASIKRIARIYLYYALSSIAIILFVVTAAKWMDIRELFGTGADQATAAIVSALTLAAPPQLTSILVLYILFTALLVPVFVAADGRYQAFALGLSAVAWVGAQLFSGYPTFLTRNLFLNPFAWQLLFAIGIVVGTARERNPSLLQGLFQHGWFTGVAWVVVLGAFMLKVLSSPHALDVADLRLDPNTLLDMKSNLSAIRLVHFLCVAYLVSAYFTQNAAFLRWRVAWPLIKMGRHSLEVFSLSVVLTAVLNVLVFTHAPSLGEWLGIDSLAFALLALTAVFLANRRAATQQ
jgi:hypothetical protein